MIYPPRTGFAEFRSLDRALRAWGGGVPVSSRDFFALGSIELSLSRSKSRVFEPPMPPTGRTRSPTTSLPCAGHHAAEGSLSPASRK